MLWWKFQYDSFSVFTIIVVYYKCILTDAHNSEIVRRNLIKTSKLNRQVQYSERNLLKYVL